MSKTLSLKLLVNLVCKRKKHVGWIEPQRIENSVVGLSNIFRKWQYIYWLDTAPDNTISLIHFNKTETTARYGKYLWEIYPSNNEEGVERFTTRKEAEIRIKEILLIS